MNTILVHNACGSARNSWKDSFRARLSLGSKPRHINSIFTVNTPIRYVSSLSLVVRVCQFAEVHQPVQSYANAA
jgi:hypothetical protein